MVSISSEGTHITTGGTEEDLFEKTGTKFYGGRIDLTNIAVSDDFTFRTYYKMSTGGSYILEHPTQIDAVPTDKSLEIPTKPSAYGFKVTVQRNSGTNRAFAFIFFEGG
jgi:hypothetical protein